MKEEKRGVEAAGVCYTYKYLKKQKSENADKVNNRSLQAEVQALSSYQNDNFFPLAKGHTLSTAGRTSRVFSSQTAST